MTTTMERSMTSSTSCPPQFRYATPRRLDRPTFGPEIAKVADMLGVPFMPHQRYVADVGGEYDPETGIPFYGEIRFTVPRQSGKTTLFLGWQINRCVSKRWLHPQRSVFTAQTGKDARDKWLDELFPQIRGSRIKRLVAVKNGRPAINEGMGNESILFKTGSLIRLLSTSTSSGHSKTLHQAVLDEIWHDVDDRREQGLRPAMITVQDKQLLVCSTAGTDASVVLNRKVESGRDAALEDRGRGVAYFECSAPEDWDPEDEASYFEFMPALCPAPPCRCDPEGKWRHTITLDALRAEREELEDPEFRRAYGNIRTSLKGERVIPADLWDAVQIPDAAPDGDVTFAVDVNHDRSSAAIGVSDGEAVEVVDHRQGVGWVEDGVAQRVKDLAGTWRGEVVIDGNGPAVPVADDLEDAGVKVRRMNFAECAAACGRIYDDIADGKIKVRPSSAALDAAVAGVAKKPAGDRFVWNRAASAADVTPLWAITLAYGARPEPEPETFAIFT